MQTRYMPADERRAVTVEAVVALAAQQNPGDITTAAIAAHMGVTQGALFRHFPTKDTLWLAVADQVAGELAMEWERALAGTDGPIDRIKALMAAQLGQIVSTPALPMLLFSRELNVGNEDLRAAFRGLLMRFQALIVAELARGQEAGRLRREVAPEDAAVLLTSLVQGMAIRWSLGARNFSLIGEGMRLLDVQLRLLTVNED